MSAVPSVASRDVAGFDHRAVLYRGVTGLVDAVVPFIREGVARGEPVLVALLAERLDAVEAALGSDAVRVDFVDMGELGGNPARIIPEWRRFVHDVGAAGPVRGVGEPIWSGRRDVELEEAELHESLLNLAFDGGPAWQLLCPYDLDGLPGEVIEEAMRNHPQVLGPDVPTTYAGHQHARARFTTPLPPAPGDAEWFGFGRDDLAGLRSVVTRLADQAGVGTQATDDLVLAAHELATNSVVHGGGDGVLRLWTEPGAFVVEVTDAGVIGDPLVGRDLVHDLAEGGRGIWMANQLCDLVQVRSRGEGTVVRLFAWV